MNMQDIIHNYESLASLTGQMRNAAVGGEWDTLVGLEQQCSRQVASMRAAAQEDARKNVMGDAPDETTRQHKIQLIKKILADDAAIRNRTESWMGQLQRVMQSNRQEQRLNQSYGAA